MAEKCTTCELNPKSRYSPAEFAILKHLLAGGGSGHGSLLIEHLNLPQTTVFNSLDRLEEQGLLTMKEEPAPNSGPPRKIFTLAKSVEKSLPCLIHGLCENFKINEQGKVQRYRNRKTGQKRDKNVIDN